MFENILGNIQQQQAELQSKLKDITVQAEAGDGAITVTAGADMHIVNIKIDPSKTDWNDREQVEDLLVVAVNRALETAKQTAGAETGKLIEGMFPFGNMKDFLGG
jgi:nucleoid-associated protein EbfC